MNVRVRLQVIKDEEGALALECSNVPEGLIYPEQVGAASTYRTHAEQHVHSTTALLGRRIATLMHNPS